MLTFPKLVAARIRDAQGSKDVRMLKPVHSTVFILNFGPTWLILQPFDTDKRFTRPSPQCSWEDKTIK
jgi:hypothetical protein